MTTPASPMYSASGTDPVLDDLVEAFASRLQAGEQLDLEAYAYEHPAHTAQLRQLLPAVQVLADLGHSAAAGEAGAPLLSPLAGPEVGLLGDFRILREVGRGGMGIVYEAEQVSIGRRVALKVLPFAAAMDARHLQRFKNEVQAAGQLHHQHIVPVHAVGCERGVHYYAMQFVDGQTLAQVIGELRHGEPGRVSAGRVGEPPGADATGLASTLPVAALSTERSLTSPAFFRTVAELGMQAAEALEHAHQQGVIHRDIKPANLLVDGRGHLWVTDFGLARLHSEAGLTQTGDVVGTLRYMSPEQALGRHALVDQRTDVYSLGATLYELLTLHPVYDGRNRQELLRQIEWDEPVPVRRRNATVPAELETIVHKALAKSPVERYATAQELADDLRRFLEDKPIRAKRPTPWQRLKKWARRHRPVVTTAGVSAVLMLVLAVAGLAYTTVRISREQEETKAALRNEEAAVYYHRIALAQADLENNNVARAAELLDHCPPERRGWEWHYLRRRFHAEPLVLPGLHVAFTPDGRRLAVAHGNDVKLRDLATGQELFACRGHAGPVTWVAISPDGRQLASASADHTVKVWDLATGAETATLHGHAKAIAHVTFHPDGRRLASISNDESVRVWDVTTGQELHCFPTATHHLNLRSVAFSPDGRLLAAGGPENTVKVWDVATGQELHSLRGHTKVVLGVVFSPDGQWLASLGDDRTAKTWDVGAGREAFSVEGRAATQFGAVFSPDSRHVAVANADAEHTITVCESATGRRVFLLQGHTYTVYDVAFSPDGRRLASVSYDKTVKLWDLTTGKEALTLRGGHSYFNRVFFSPDGSRLIATSLKGYTYVWDATPLDRAGPECLTLDGHTGPVYSLAFSPDGHLLASPSQDRTVRVWDLTTRREVLTLRGHTRIVRGVAFSSDGRRLVTTSVDGTFKVWDAASGQELHTVPAHVVFTVSLSPDGRRLAGHRDGAIKVWDAETGQELLSGRGESKAPITVVFSPDGRRLASVALDGLVTVWDAGTGQQLRVLRGHTERVFVPAFSPDGRLLATGGMDETVRLWDPETGEELRTLEGHPNWVTSLAFSPDGRRLAVGCSAGVKIWDPATGELVRLQRGHAGVVWGVAYSPDGSRLAVGSGYAGKGEVKVWNVAALERLLGPRPANAGN